jgi:hypothetical protein
MLMNSELLITIGVLVVELLILGLCYIRAKQPPNPLKPRILPYGLIMIFLGLAVFVTTAHVISVTTGHRLEAKNKMKGTQ